MAIWLWPPEILDHQAAQPRAIVIEKLGRAHGPGHQDGVVRQLGRNAVRPGPPRQNAQQAIGKLVEIPQALVPVGIGLAQHARAPLWCKATKSRREQRIAAGEGAQTSLFRLLKRNVGGMQKGRYLIDRERCEGDKRPWFRLQDELLADQQNRCAVAWRTSQVVEKGAHLAVCFWCAEIIGQKQANFVETEKWWGASHLGQVMA